MVDYTFGTIDSGAAETGSPYVVGARSISAPDMGANVGIGDLFSPAKLAFKAVAPQTYAEMTSWLPTWSEISSSLGLDGLFGGGAATELATSGAMDSLAFGGAAPLMEGGGVAAGSGLAGGTGAAAGSMGALGGAASALGYAAPALAVAMLLSKIGDTGDTSVSYGSGWGDLDEGYTALGGPRPGEAAGLWDRYTADHGWYEGGDPSQVERLPVDVGSMSMRSTMPYFSVGGARYRTPELAISSGRQIARGQMGLPVDYEALPQGYGMASDPMLSRMQGDQSMPVWDAPQALPSDWDTWQDRAQNSSYSGQSNTEAGAWAPETIAAYAGSQTPRGRQFFDTGLTVGQMYQAAGPGSPDWGAEVADLAEVPGEMERFRSRPSLANYQFGVLG